MYYGSWKALCRSIQHNLRIQSLTCHVTTFCLRGDAQMQVCGTSCTYCCYYLLSYYVFLCKRECPNEYSGAPGGAQGSLGWSGSSKKCEPLCCKKLQRSARFTKNTSTSRGIVALDVYGKQYCCMCSNGILVLQGCFSSWSANAIYQFDDSTDVTKYDWFTGTRVLLKRNPLFVIGGRRPFKTNSNPICRLLRGNKFHIMLAH